ncbi:alpha/beta-hydrolase [Punctularia strigosozonata HHB-11173 SS5]|uniref:Alpha/beta-hydrolase n=1 Tax=Punctularia strigosozonata (strain HHB-11173) TaxID=741275 RepID=R7S3X9_PUNST|nr:alpha/beta-hydrolase [Punctularia strigosozonata HHB-11173 SS5]EIN03941.1 alpha/beta-hydrolase [Punctularia strigosozonata HHB-11173 SS5]
MQRALLSSRPRTSLPFYLNSNQRTWSSPQGLRFNNSSADSNADITPIDLEYDAVLPPHTVRSSRPLVILHGLFGSKRNWGGLCKQFGKELHRPIYALDLRNHGHSPHALPHTYPAMAADLLHFFKKHHFEKISLLGHSMGGKAAMAVALSDALPPGLLEHLIIVDIAPSKGSLSPEFQRYIEVMHQIEQAHISTRKEADQMMKSVEPDPSVRAFLLTNLVGSAPLKFRVPVDTIRSSLDALGDFPYDSCSQRWEGKTLFIKGEHSRYINNRNQSNLEQFFPNMKLEHLPTGHWVHAEKPNEFKQLVLDFVRS